MRIVTCYGPADKTALYEARRLPAGSVTRPLVRAGVLDAVACRDLLCGPEADDAHGFLHLRTLSRDNRGKLRGSPISRVDASLLQALRSRGVGENVPLR